MVPVLSQCAAGQFIKQISYTMVVFNQTLIACLLVVICWGLEPKRLTKKIYQERMLSQFNNNHFFIVTSKHVDIKEIAIYLSEFENDHKIQLYHCIPTENRQFCPLDIPIFLIINTIRIDFNGRQEHHQDYFKWIEFRVTEYPHRLHSIEELKFHVQDKNEVFCFVDRQGQQITKKQYIFIATAKKLHFLYYCSLDVSIANLIGLKQGHLALIRKDLSYNFDYWSQKLMEDNVNLHQYWCNFILMSCQSQFRLQNKGRSHDIVTVECDISLECEQELMEILAAELKWRVKHPELNFNMKFIPGKAGQFENRNKVYDYPVLKYAKVMIEKKIVHQPNGAVLEETDYIMDTYMKAEPIIDQNTIENLLQEYGDEKLQYVIRDIETSIRSLDNEEGEYHRRKKRENQEQRSQEL